MSRFTGTGDPGCCCCAEQPAEERTNVAPEPIRSLEGREVTPLANSHASGAADVDGPLERGRTGPPRAVEI
jgi:hypothetical protein